MAEPWTIKGEYLENCNCEVLCPCLLGPQNARGGAMARPTEGTCDVPVVFAIERGSLVLTPQSADAVTYAAKLAKDATRIDWKAPAGRVHDQHVA